MRRVDMLLTSIAGVLFAPGIVLTATDLLPLPTQIDFAAYYLAAVVLRQGGDPYDAETLAVAAAQSGVVDYTPYIYPPLLAQLVQPLTFLPYHTAAVIWLAASAAALVAALVLLRSVAAIPNRAFPLTVAAVFVSPPVHHTLELGQINHFLLLLLAAAAMTTRQMLSGTLIGVAAAIKAFPLGIGAVFAIKGQVRAAVAVGVGLVAATTVTVVSPTAHLAMVEWMHHVVPEINADRLITPNNQSVSAVTQRLFARHTFEGMPIDAARSTTVTLEPVVDAPGAASIVTWAVTLAVALVTAATLVASRRSNTAGIRTLQFGIVIAALLITLPVVWDHYYVFLFVPLAALSGAASRQHLRLTLVGIILILAHRYWRLVLYAGSPGLVSTGLLGVLTIWTASAAHLFARARNPGAAESLI